jgi:hypothetical protein
MVCSHTLYSYTGIIHRTHTLYSHTILALAYCTQGVRILSEDAVKAVLDKQIYRCDHAMGWASSWSQVTCKMNSYSSL